MAAEKKMNYTAEMTADLIERYQAGESVESLGRAFGKTPRSIISKLVREGAYVAPEKPAKVAKDEGPTKKELLNTLESLVDFPVEGLMGATKEAIAHVIALAEAVGAENQGEVAQAA